MDTLKKTREDSAWGGVRGGQQFVGTEKQGEWSGES